MKMLMAVGVSCAALCAAPDVAAPSLDTGYRQMYNLQFEDAHRTFHLWEAAHPANPMGPASDAAAYLFSELDRLHVLQSEFFADDQNFQQSHGLTPDPRLKRDFEDALERARKAQPQAASAQAGAADGDALLAQVLAYGLHSDYQALIEKRYVAALSETKQARMAAERLLAVQPADYDGYLAIGVENYLLSLKPAPLRWVLRMGGARTDRQVGLDRLRLTAEKGHYLRPFAKLLLAVAALRDKDRVQARQQLTWLASNFPANHLFREELAKVQ